MKEASGNCSVWQFPLEVGIKRARQRKVSIWAAGWAVSTVAVLGAGAAVLTNIRQHGSTDDLKDCSRL